MQGAAARRRRGPPFATLPITAHMPPRHGSTPLQTSDFDLRRRRGWRKIEEGSKGGGHNRPLRTGRLQPVSYTHMTLPTSDLV